MIGENVRGVFACQEIIETTKFLKNFESLTFVCIPVLLMFRLITTEKIQQLMGFIGYGLFKFGRVVLSFN